MNLPKRTLTTYHTTLPSDKKKRVSYHPFLVREQKAMLAAQVAEDPKVMFSTVKDVVQGCLETPLNVNDMVVFDFEHLFIKLREVSVGELARLRFFCQTPECQHNKAAFVEQDVDLRKVKTEKKPGHTQIIKLFDDNDADAMKLYVHMKYMTVGDLDLLDEDEEDELEGLFNMVACCIDAVYEGETKYDAKDFTKEQIKDFLNSLSGDQFEKIEEFFATSPRPSLEVEYTCPVCLKHHKEVLEGMKSFF